jgi:UDP-N-acetylmuramate--alanine ligase
VVILTSAEWDHPDVFTDRADVLDAFEAWLRRSVADPGGRPPVLIANVGDPGVAEIADRLGDWPGTLLAVALVDAAPQRIGGLAKGIAGRYSTALGPARPLIGRITAATPAGTTMELHGLEPLSGPAAVTLRTAGRHNAANALGVAGAAASLGLRADAIVAGLASFGGVGRRLERKGEARGVAVYDDYGHHPTALRGTIAAVRQREPGRRVWAVYEPLTYHRTAALLGEFAAALATADAVAVADIWASRDPDTTITSAGALAGAVARLRPEIPHEATGSVEATAEWLAGQVRAGDAVLVMGGGRSYRIGELLLARLKRRGD